MKINILLTFIVSLLMAILSAYIASKRQRNSVVWFFIGLFFGWLGPLLAFFLPSGVGKGAIFQKKDILSLPLDKEKNLLSINALHSPDFTPTIEKKWFYLDGEHQQQGPVYFVELKQLWQQGKISRKNYLWQEGMTEWRRVEQLPGIEETFSKEN